MPRPYSHRSESRSRSPSLPAWYHRILEYPDHTVTPEDFDEDLSDLSSEFEEESEGDAESDQGSEGDSEPADDDSKNWLTGYPSDNEGSETQSRAGSEYDYYYELKEQREERKWQRKQEVQNGQTTMREDTEKVEKEMERDVRQVLHKVKHQRGARKKLFLRGRVFNLGSLDHFQHAYLGHTPSFMSKYVEFYHYPEVRSGDEPDSYRPPPDQEPGLVGHVHMHSNTASAFRGPAPPPRCGLGEFKVGSGHGEHRLVFQFLDNHHLIMKMPRELVFACHPRKMPASAPKTFVFYGIEEGWAAGSRGS